MQVESPVYSISIVVPETAAGHRKGSESFQERYPMLGWAIFFLVIALVTGFLGFGGIAGTAAGIAKILFIVFLVLFAIGLVMHFVRGASQTA